MPAGFLAGGLVAGIKASGRPDLMIVRRRRPGGPRRGRGGLHPERLRGGAGEAVARRTSPAPSRPARAGTAGRQAVISTSGCANAATGLAGARTRPSRGRPRRGARDRAGPDARALDGADRDPAAGPDRAQGHRDARRDRPARRRDGVLAAAEALRTTDSRTKYATATSTCPAPGGADAVRARHGHRQGRRDDPSAHGDDAVGAADGRDRGPGRRCTGCCDAPRCGPGTSSPSTATRARTTRSS